MSFKMKLSPIPTEQEPWNNTKGKLSPSPVPSRLAFVQMLRPFISELDMSTDLFSFEQFPQYFYFA